MLKKRDRLSKREVETLLKKGRRLHSTLLTVAYLPAPHTKAAVVVGKKIAKKAVQRHLLRRRVFHLLERWGALYNGKHVAVLLHPDAAHATYQELEQTLTHLLEKV